MNLIICENFVISKRDNILSKISIFYKYLCYLSFWKHYYINNFKHYCVSKIYIDM